MKLTGILLVVFAASVVISPMTLADDAANEVAIASATTWLGLVDDAKYGDGWETASEYFKGAVTKEQLEASLTAVRTPLGKLISRTVKSADYKTELPGAPDGEYVVIQFNTVFENKKSTIETITPMKDKDGTWKVSGYFIK